MQEFGPKSSTSSTREDRKLYYVWKAMKDRCNNPKNKSYAYYGGRGITMDLQWLSFKEFESWSRLSGYCVGLQLDRVDNLGGYSPDNCRWTTRSQNMRNTRHSLVIEAFGESKSLREWFEDSRCRANSYNTLHSRIVSGVNPEYAITAVSGPSGRRHAQKH